MRELTKGGGLMLALDVRSSEEARRIVRVTRPHLDALKIGWGLLTSPEGGLHLIGGLCEEFDLPALVDAKIHDVPHIACNMISNLKAHGAEAITVWTSAGEATLRACVEEFSTSELFLLTGLTSSSAADALDSVSEGLVLAAKYGYRNVQVPGNYPEAVTLARDRLGPAACLVACGIGAQGGEPGEAAAAGANYEIVGRDIYLAADPAAIAQRYRDRILEATQERTGLAG